LYFASLLSKVPTTTKRLILSSVLGAIISVLVILMPEVPIIKFIIATVGLLLMGCVAPKPIRMRRKIKFIFSFLIFEALIGGAVTFLWEIFDTYLSAFINSSDGGAVNRKMLILSVIVLISIGVFKMLISFFSNSQSEGSVEVEISFLNNNTVLSAFVDSGNLAVDPMDMSPVLLIKKEAAKKFLPNNIIELSNIDELDKNIKKRIRLIPITRGGATHVLVGIKADKVKLINKEKYEELSLTIAIDKEGGTFGGFDALMPSAALDNVLDK
jgi:sigma-E processing peptidase SpoIIGA